MVSSHGLMNFNGSAQAVVNGTYLVPLRAIVPLTNIKIVALRSLVHLIFWVSREQRAKE